MLIKLPDIQNPDFNEIYVGHRKRLATASGCTFLSNNILAVLNLVSQRIYIIRIDFDSKSHEIIDYIETTFAGKLCASDLITSRENLIAVSNFDRSISIYKYQNEHLARFMEFAFPDLGYCHGIKFYTDDILCFTSMQLLDCICFFNFKQGRMLYTFDFKIPGPRDICFLSSNKMVVIYTTKPPSTRGPYNLTDSKVQLIEFDLGQKTSTLISEFTIPNSQIDSCDKINHLVYITTAQENMDTVHVLDTRNDKLCLHNVIKGFHIPHGIATLNHLLAVTNYFDNTVKIVELQKDLAGADCSPDLENELEMNQASKGY